MPRKARYWANPELHRFQNNQRFRRNSALGYKGGHKNPDTYVRHLEYCKHKNHNDPKRKAALYKAVCKYRKKLNAAGFPSNSRGIYFYARTYGTLKDGYRRLPQYDAPEKAKLLKVRRGSSGKANGDSMSPNHHSKLTNNILRRKPRKKRSSRAKGLRRG